ncbi:uncharacterized protein LOC111360675 [Spodoptera litura]|uniref:Uncharacterized protein LOC111360675 n=1 Tax=Spodoptera litura TaxID=69820 RepID=A0A9J7ELA2_SPOLT|nr:uncharacterized protein LOC111360675 [Spodoptera litura]
MDRFRQKSKKEKPMKYVDKDQSPLFITDVKAIKENLKIKEILRTVKMNSSMRIKAPKGSKVMQNKDFNDNEDIFGVDQNSDDQNSENQNIPDPPSATNPDVIVSNNSEETGEANAEETVDKHSESEEEILEDCIENESTTDPIIHESISVPEGLQDFVLISEENKQDIEEIADVKIDSPPPSEISHVKARDRKLSLDQTMLSRRGGLSQSELDLNSIGKSPLERKSSFFRKKMDSFLKNTTEIFKRQSIGRSQSIQSKSSMSVSLQSLNENIACNGHYGEPLHNHEEELQRSTTSLQSSPTAARSTSSLSISQSEQTLPDQQSEGDSISGSRPILIGSQPLGDTSPSINSLNETYIQESMLNRAISMSSGLDSATGQNRRKSRSNRVTWLASEGLTNYLRRVIQDEKSREINLYHSYQDFSAIPENNVEPKTDSKGRRLSYQRAVSGEDPRYLESNIRRKQLIPENHELNLELSDLLAEYSRTGVPDLKGFCIANIPDEAFEFLQWAEKPQNLEEFIDWKKLPQAEEARQAVIKELICTEADYIRHLLSIVQVFIAAAHGLQDAGKLLDIDTEKLFTNIPDVLNASLYFWETTIYPMIADAHEKKAPFNTEIMAPGFMHFRDMFQPYEKYVNEQTKALDYLRSLSNNADFMCYLTWCYRQKACNRLQLADIMVKPMQRLTKYSLLLRRLIAHTDIEPERTSLQAMETCAKNYVQDLNRSIRQREELEKMDKLANSIEAYEVDFKDEELDKFFHLYSQLNLRAPMVNCSPHHSRTLIHQGDLRFKDNIKEMEVRVFLLTDMLLICKKQSKGSLYPYKMVRPKYFLERLFTYPKISQRNPKEIANLVFVAVDEVGSSLVAFSLSESSKDPSAQGTLKNWEQKIREARLTYDLAVWFTRNPSRDLTEMDVDSSSDYGLSIPSASRPGAKQSSDELNIDREARERVAAMLHRSLGVSTECDNFSQASMNTDSFDGELSTSHGGRYSHGLRYPMKRNSTGGSSRNSRLSSFHQSTSAASHDEPQPGPSRYRAGTSVEHVIPPQNPEDGVTSITVNVVSESESETVVHSQPPPPLVVLQHSSPHKTPIPSRSSSTSRNTLRVQPQNVVMALVHSLPDLTFDTSPPRPQQSPSPQSASEKLYQSHQELLQRNRLSAQQQQHYLSPDHRGTSYPPPSPTRASLKRGLAFSYSFKNPPLSKMGHVNSQSQHADAGPSTSQGTKGEKGPPPGGQSQEKADKKSKHVSSRHKGGSLSPGSRKEDKGG